MTKASIVTIFDIIKSVDTYAIRSHGLPLTSSLKRFRRDLSFVNTTLSAGLEPRKNG